MKKRIGFCILVGFILGSVAGGIASVEALKPLSAAQEVEKVIVPNVTGIPSDVAVQILQMAGLAAKIQSGSGRSLIVDRQEPRAGNLAALGSEVVLEVGGVTSDSSEVKPLSLSPEAPQPDTGAGGITTLKVQEGQVHVLRDLYGPQGATVHTKPIMAWYPQGFLTSGSRSGSSAPSLLGTPSAPPDGRSNVFQAQPLQLFSGDDIPIIMAPTEGWQHGWVPYGSYTPVQQPVYSYSTGSSFSSIQSLPGSAGFSGQSYSVSTGRLIAVPSLIRLSVSEAEGSLKKRGLEVGKVIQVEGYQTDKGLIGQQFPAANSLVPKGAKIDLWVVK